MTERDEQLELKKRARRRLVGAAAFALLAVIVLPMVMDETPPPSVSQVQIRIPGQDAPLPPVTAAKPASTSAAPTASPAQPSSPAAAVVTPAAPVVDPSASAGIAGEPGKLPAPADLASSKPASAAAATPAAPTQSKPADSAKADGERAAAILAGKEAQVPHVVLIGAFANAANVKTLQRKLSEMGIKSYTEALDSPTGRKTRVRAGPFPTREAAERARERMKRIGVNGVVAAKS